ncbi:hypothetical protein COL59_17080, partial [Bacillus toyonensis]
PFLIYEFFWGEGWQRGGEICLFIFCFSRVKQKKVQKKMLSYFFRKTFMFLIGKLNCYLLTYKPHEINVCFVKFRLSQLKYTRQIVIFILKK